MILVNKDTKLIVQGATGKMGAAHTKRMLNYGTNIVAGVTPGKSGQEIHGVPVYDTVKAAVKETWANASVIFVPPYLTYDAASEALAAGIKLLVVITEGIPPLDTMKMAQEVKQQ